MQVGCTLHNLQQWKSRSTVSAKRGQVEVSDFVNICVALAVRMRIFWSISDLSFQA